jgi:outer membrane protein OmpA-like peptidoglycan-associated protein
MAACNYVACRKVKKVSGRNEMSGMEDTNTNGLNTGVSGDGLAPLSARLNAAEKRKEGPGIFLPVIGVIGAAAVAYITFYTIANGDGTLFPEKKEMPVSAPVVAAPPIAMSVPAWLANIDATLKSSFAWLSLGLNGQSIIVSGEADDEATKLSALKEVTTAVQALPEGANTLIIDNIKVKGSTLTPVGAGLAAIGDAPNAVACENAFTATMAGRTINFSTSGATIGGDNASLLDTLTAVATACKAHKIEINGHTDSVGKPEENQILSQQRADAVKAYWTTKGVAAAGLVATGFGESKPIEPVADETANERNRRIEFSVTNFEAAGAATPEPMK